MSFFADLFKKDKKDSQAVVLIDIGASSVAGAYAHYVDGKTPILLHTSRVPINSHADEAYESALIRTLSTFGNDLLREGAPILARHTGSGASDSILVSIDLPDQEIKMRTESFERASPFIFTKKMMNTMLERTRVVPQGRSLTDESIVNAILNGYDTRSPYDKSARRVSLMVASSIIDSDIFDSIISTLRGLYHTENIFSVAGRTLRSQAIHDAFPHERDALIVDATGPDLSIALIRKNIFTAIANSLQELAHHPMPQIVFIIADEPKLPVVQQMIREEKSLFGANSPKIVPVVPSHLSSLLRHAAPTQPDLSLLLMALYHQNHSFNGEI